MGSDHAAVTPQGRQIPKYRRADIHTVSSADRPTSTAYDRFAYLVKFFADREYDEARIRSECPFLVQDVLFNSLLCKANRDLAEIARVIGEDPSSYDELAEKTKVPSTRNSGTRIAGYTWTTILPMTGTYAFTSGQTWRDRYMLVFPARMRQAACWTPWKTMGSDCLTRTLRPYRATTCAATVSRKIDTGEDPCGST